MDIQRPQSLQKAVLVTHAGCLDGSGCALVFLAAGGKRQNIIFIGAGMVDKFIRKDLSNVSDKFVIFADIGITSQVNRKYVETLEKRGNCVLLDHHATSLHLSQKDWCVIRQDVCGADLLREYLGVVDPSIVKLSSLIRDHDLWTNNDPVSEDLATFSAFVGQEDFIDRFIGRDVTTGFGVFNQSEMDMLEVIRKKRDEAIEDAMKRMHVRNLEDGEGTTIAYVVSSEQNVSLLLNTILKKHPEVKIACQINLEKNTASLRSRKGEYDVSELAKIYGGGGHTCAAGHKISDKLVDDLIGDIICTAQFIL